MTDGDKRQLAQHQDSRSHQSAFASGTVPHVEQDTAILRIHIWMPAMRHGLHVSHHRSRQTDVKLV